MRKSIETKDINPPAFKDWLKKKIKSNHILFPIARCFYAFPHLNVSARKNFKRLNAILHQEESYGRLLLIGGGTDSHGADIKVLDLSFRNKIINLEIEPGPLVTVVGDGHYLSFRDGAFDAVISQAVLEHVKKPEKMIREMERVLRPGGYIYVEVPFLQPFHAYPDDYQRYTMQGLIKLCSPFDKKDGGITCGPCSTLAWIMAEFFSIIFSFNSEILYTIWNILFRFIFSPFKYLDLLVNKYDAAINIASGVYFLGKKTS